MKERESQGTAEGKAGGRGNIRGKSRGRAGNSGGKSPNSACKPANPLFLFPFVCILQILEISGALEL
jgi:hypothetical protein